MEEIFSQEAWELLLRMHNNVYYDLLSASILRRESKMTLVVNEFNCSRIVDSIVATVMPGYKVEVKTPYS